MRRIIGWVWRVVVCAIIYCVGTMVGGVALQKLGVPSPVMPEGITPEGMAKILPLAAIVFAAGLSPMARRIRGGFLLRWLVLAIFLYGANGINNSIEAAVFTKVGGFASLAAYNFVPLVFLAAALALLFAPSGKGVQSSQRILVLSPRSPDQWLWRIAAAIVAFPVIYFIFGNIIGPFVIDYYKQGAFSLVLPTMAVVIRTQFIRSVIFFASAFPVIVLWHASRRQLIGWAGLGHYVTIGLVGMVLAVWMPANMRIIHGLELLADSFVYIFVLAMLFTRPEQQTT
jgi:hypothetical protein